MTTKAQQEVGQFFNYYRKTLTKADCCGRHNDDADVVAALLTVAEAVTKLGQKLDLLMADPDAD